MENVDFPKLNIGVVTDCCSFIVKNIKTNEIRSFNINAAENPKQRRFVGKKINEEFDIPEAKIKYRILEILPPNEASKKLGSTTNNINLLDVDKLMAQLEQYDFEGFIHTTEIENFKSILECGYLIPRNNLIKNGIRFKNSAEMGVLEKTTDFVKNCCRFYNYNKTPTNYKATIEGKYKDPIILVFDKNLAYGNNVFFSPVNAQQGTFMHSAKEALNFDWQGIFERRGYSSSKYCHHELTDEISKKISLTRNAEFLVNGKVSVNHIYKICVSSQRQYDLLKSFCNDEIMKKVVKESDKFDKIF